MNKIEFDNFADALDYFLAQRRAGKDAVYYPSGGIDRYRDTPVKHIVVVLEDENV